MVPHKQYTADVIEHIVQTLHDREKLRDIACYDVTIRNLSQWFSLVSTKIADSLEHLQVLSKLPHASPLQRIHIAVGRNKWLAAAVYTLVNHNQWVTTRFLC